MIRKFLYLATACLYLFMTSCTSGKEVRPGEIRDQSDHIIAVLLTSGEVVKFDDDGGRFDSIAQIISGRRADGTPFVTPLADVVSATVERTNATTAVVVVVILGLFVALIAATSGGDDEPQQTSSSCPYVYSYDGSRYVLDAEPLSGAITKGLERDDLCRLESLRAADGRYELLVRNELDETQYLDRMTLCVAEHPAGSEVYSDINGVLHTVTGELPPAAARDETGMDLRAALAEADQISWQSRMPADDSWRGVSLRHDMEFSFPKPADKSSGNLVVGAATSQWGSVMMREMMQARGDKLAEWRLSVDENGAAMAELIRFNLREELYFLKLYVREGDQWVQRGLIPGGGPMAAETRVIPLDLSHVTGDTVALRIAPPRGYWAFDYLAMSYDKLAPPRISEIPLGRAAVGNGDDATASLRAGDGVYHEMRRTGDSMVLTFDAPAFVADGTHTVFLDTRGYYHSHVDESQPEQADLIREMLDNDGAIVRYSLQKFAEFAGRRAAR